MPAASSRRRPMRSHSTSAPCAPARSRAGSRSSGPGSDVLATGARGLSAGGARWGGGRRRGGSTITMQLARRLYGLDSRTVPGKLRQIAAAIWLELRYSKRDILEAHLNLAPFGGNVEGVGAASLVYFHKRAARLTTP